MQYQLPSKVSVSVRQLFFILKIEERLCKSVNCVCSKEIVLSCNLQKKHKREEIF